MRDDYIYPVAPDHDYSRKGIFTPKGRCFEFYKKLKECERKAELPKIDCPPYFEDYLECLHHSKEVFIVVTNIIPIAESKVSENNPSL